MREHVWVLSKLSPDLAHIFIILMIWLFYLMHPVQRPLNAPTFHNIWYIMVRTCLLNKMYHAHYLSSVS